MKKHSGHFKLKQLTKTADLQSKSSRNCRIWNSSGLCGIRKWHLSPWMTGNNAFSAGYHRWNMRSSHAVGDFQPRSYSPQFLFSSVPGLFQAVVGLRNKSPTSELGKVGRYTMYMLCHERILASFPVEFSFSVFIIHLQFPSLPDWPFLWSCLSKSNCHLQISVLMFPLTKPIERFYESSSDLQPLLISKIHCTQSHKTLQLFGGFPGNHVWAW